MFRLIKKSHIKHLAGNLDEYSNGNIYRGLNPVNYPSSIRGIVNGIERLRKMVRLFYVDMGVSTGKVRGSVQEMNHALKSAGENVAQAVKYSSMAHSIAADIVESSTAAEFRINEIKDSAGLISEVAADIHSDSAEAKNLSESAFAAMEDAAGAFKELSKTSQYMADRVKLLNENTREIDLLLLVIQSIANQTDLLALNAAIEAARAGAHGRGFSIVADEIQKLSAEASQAADSANRLLARVNSGIHETASFVSEGEGILQSGGSSVNRSRNYIQELFKKNISIEEKTSKAKTAAEEQLQSIAVIAEYSGKNADTCRLAVSHTEMVNSLMDRQGSLFDGIFSMGTSLNRIADELVMAGKSVSITELSAGGGEGGIRPGIENLEPELKKIASLLSGDIGEAGEHRRKIESFLNAHDDLEAAWTNSSDGRFIVSIPPAGIANAGGREWFTDAMKDVFFISEVYISAITKNPCITISLPLKKGGKITGVLGVDLKLGSE